MKAIGNSKWDYAPKADDDVVKSAKEDTAKTVKDSSNLKGAAKQAVIDAAGRAVARNLARSTYAGKALQVGYDAGRDLDEKTGIGKAMVDKSGLGDIAARAATPEDRVELSQSAKDRIAAGELDKKYSNKPLKAPVSSSESNSGPRDDIGTPKEPTSENLKKGGKVRSHSSKRGDGIAQRGHTKGRYM